MQLSLRRKSYVFNMPYHTDPDLTDPLLPFPRVQCAFAYFVVFPPITHTYTYAHSIQLPNTISGVRGSGCPERTTAPRDRVLVVGRKTMTLQQQQQQQHRQHHQQFALECTTTPNVL